MNCNVHVFDILFKICLDFEDPSGFNITYRNGTSYISDFNETFLEDMSSNTSIVDDNGEVLIVKVSKNRYLMNISYYNIDAFTWKESGNETFIDYVSEVPGHPEYTGDVVEEEEAIKENESLIDTLCGLPYLLILVILIVVIIIIATMWRLRY